MEVAHKFAAVNFTGLKAVPNCEISCEWWRFVTPWLLVTVTSCGAVAQHKARAYLKIIYFAKDAVIESIGRAEFVALWFFKIAYILAGWLSPRNVVGFVEHITFN